MASQSKVLWPFQSRPQTWTWRSPLFFLIFFISWRLITLQYCSGFCHTLKWISQKPSWIFQPHQTEKNWEIQLTAEIAASDIWPQINHPKGFLGGASGKEPTCQCRRHKRLGFNPWVRKTPWRRAWQPTPVSLPGESHGLWAWWTTVHSVKKSQIGLKWLHMYAYKLFQPSLAIWATWSSIEQWWAILTKPHPNSWHTKSWV